jgi:transposase-like protein
MLKILISTSHSKIDTSNCDNIQTKKILSLIKEKFTVHKLVGGEVIREDTAE